MAGDLGSISVICSMSGSYVNEESSLRVYVEHLWTVSHFFRFSESESDKYIQVYVYK